MYEFKNVTYRHDEHAGTVLVLSNGREVRLKEHRSTAAAMEHAKILENTNGR